MKDIWIIIVFILTGFCCFSQAQKTGLTGDCEKQAFEESATSNENNPEKKNAKYLESLAKCYIPRQQYDKALEALIKSSRIYKKLNLEDSYWKVIRTIGYVHYETGDYNKAMEHYLDALKYFEHQQDWKNIAHTYNNIGILFHRQQEIERALFYYNNAEKILKNHPGIKGEIYPMLHTNIGLSYYELREYEKAKEHYQTALKFNEEIGDMHIYTVTIGNLASSYQGLKEYEKAEAHFKEAIEKSREMGNEMSEIINYGDLGSMYLNMATEEPSGKKREILLDRAIQHFRKALPVLKKNDDLRRYSGYSGELSRAYELKGDFKKSLEIYKEHISYENSIFNDENRKELSRREIGYEFEKREDSIRMANEKEIAVRDATLAANNKQKWLFITGLFLLSVIGVLLFYQNYMRKRNNEKLTLLNKELNEANQIKTRFFSILNHDLRGPVSNIIKFIRLQQSSAVPIDEPTKQRLENQTVKSAENLLSSMEDLLLWSKGQMENFRPQFKKTEIAYIFEDIRTFFNDVSDVKITFENPEKLSLYTDENYLKTIMRNLTSNALKALVNTDNPQIIWRSCTEAGNLILSVTDNGKGGTTEQFRALYDEKYIVGIKTGLGLHLVRDMAKAIDSTIEVTSVTGKGTTIRIIFASGFP